MTNLKYQLQGMKNLNYLVHHILYQIFKIILNIYLKNMGGKAANHSVKIYIDKRLIRNHSIRIYIDKCLKLKQDIVSNF